MFRCGQHGRATTVWGRARPRCETTLSPEQVAERIIEFKKVGIDLMLTGFLHVREEEEDLSVELHAAEGLVSVGLSS